MKKFFKIPNIFISTLLCLFPFTSTLAIPDIGSTAPNFALKNSAGDSVSLNDYAGKIIILEWTNHDCPFVRKHYSSDNMQRLQKLYTAKDVVWLSIISSAPGKQGHISGEQANTLTLNRDAAPTAVLLDPRGIAGRLYGARTTPHLFIIDQDGILQYSGAIDSINSSSPSDITKADNYLVAAMSELMSGKVISKPQTQPYGCSVKY